MKVLFGHDHFFRRDDSNVIYSRGAFPYSALSRYLRYFESLTMLARDGGEVNASSDSGSIASGHGVAFELVASISNLRSIVFVDPSLKRKIESLVRTHDGVIARLPSEIGLLVVKEAIKQQKPYAIEVVGCPYDSYSNHGSLKARLYAPLAAARLRKAVKSAPYVTYVTRSFLQKRYPCVGGMVAAFSDVTLTMEEGDFLENRLNRIRSCSKEKIVFGLIGNYFAKYKGIDVAIKALALAKDRLPSFEFRVLGSGDSSELRRLAAKLQLTENVFFDPARASGDAVNAWLDAVDVYLQPSLTEGLPRALIEAKSRGCPALGSRAGGISELLSPEKLAIPGSPEDLARLLIELANDRQALELSAVRNFNESHEYSPENLARKRDGFWKSFSDYCAAR